MDCAIRTDDAMVSRHHARIFWGGGGYVLEDLGSANGVYFQEQRVQSHLFNHGDAIRCGSLWLRFVDAAQVHHGGGGLAPPPPPAYAPPMMQHPGMGVSAPAGPTGHVSAMSNPASPASPQPAPSVGPNEADVEIRVLRRRVEQLQTELRAYRANKLNPGAARRIEDLEHDLTMIEIERDNLRVRVDRAEHPISVESGDVQVRRALEIAAMTAETAASVNDLLSSLRIEVMAADGELDQHAHSMPNASYERIRQSLKDSAACCDEARELLRKLREVAA